MLYFDKNETLLRKNQIDDLENSILKILWDYSYEKKNYTFNGIFNQPFYRNTEFLRK